MKKLLYIAVGLVIGWWCTGMYYTSESSKQKLATEYAKKLEKELETQTAINTIMNNSMVESVKDRAIASYKRDSMIMKVIANYDKMSKQQIIKTLSKALTTE